RDRVEIGTSDASVASDAVEARELVSVGGRSESARSELVVTNVPPSNMPPDGRRRDLRVSVVVEVVIAVVVLVVTALLVDSRPAYEVVTGPQIVTLKSDDVWFDLIVDPAKAGVPNQIHLTAVTPTGGSANPLQMTMELREPARDVGPLKVPLIRA